MIDHLFKLLLLCVGLALSSLTFAVSFDCTKASTASEYAICNSQILSTLDDQLASLYRNARSTVSNPEQLKNEQLAWLGIIKKCNGDPACIENAYRQRISVLSPNSLKQSSSKNLPPCQGGNTGAWNLCFGTKNYPNGDRYAGEWLEGKASGQGTYTSRASAATYMGQFSADTFSGTGTMTWTNGAKFVGQWKNDAGVTGTMTYANATTAIGTVRNAIFYAAAQQPQVTSNQKQSGLTNNIHVESSPNVVSSTTKPNADYLLMFNNNGGAYLSISKTIGGDIKLSTQSPNLYTSYCYGVVDRRRPNKEEIVDRETGWALHQILVQYLTKEVNYIGTRSGKLTAEWKGACLYIPERGEAYIPQNTEFAFIDLSTPETLRNRWINQAINSGMIQIGKISAERIADQNEVNKKQFIQNKTNQSNINNLIRNLAQQKSKSTIAAIEFLNINASNYCKPQVAGENAVLFSAYISMLNKKLAINHVGGLDRDFLSIDEFYRQFGNNRDICRYYIDFPENIQLIATAIARDYPQVSFVITFPQERNTLLNEWATMKGFKDHESFALSASTGASKSELNELNKYSVRTTEDFSKIVFEMVKAGYAQGRNLRDVLNYLRDKATAAASGKSNETAIDVLNARVAAAEQYRATEEVKRKKAEADRLEAERIADEKKAEQERIADANKWFGVSGIGGMITGGCTVSQSAEDIVRLAQQGFAQIISEKTTSGKVVELTYSFKGQQITIYRGKATCEAIASARKKQQNTVSDKYK